MAKFLGPNSCLVWCEGVVSRQRAVARGKASGWDVRCGPQLLYTSLCTQCSWNRTYLCALNGDFCVTKAKEQGERCYQTIQDSDTTTPTAQEYTSCSKQTFNVYPYGILCVVFLATY